MDTRRLVLLAAATAALLFVAGCGSRAPVITAGAPPPPPTPTIAPMFAEFPTSTPRPTAEPRPQATDTPRPAATSAGAATAAPTAEGTAQTAAATAAGGATPAPTRDPGDPTAGLVVVPVYRDGLSNGWSLTNSVAMEYITRSTAFVDEGQYALEAITRADFATLYFTVREDSEEQFERSRVAGLRFRVTGGESPIANDQLLVTVVGSNSQPYWVKNDTSVTIEGRVTDDGPLFSETRLYYLNINETIPAGEWTDVIVWLDDLLFDPDYQYVTGFYLKTDGLERFFLDDVTLLLEPEAGAQG